MQTLKRKKNLKYIIYTDSSDGLGDRLGPRCGGGVVCVYGTDKPFLRVSHAYLQAQSPGGSPLSAHGLATPSRRVLNRPSDLHGGREAHLCHCCRSVMSDSLLPHRLSFTTSQSLLKLIPLSQ